MSNELKRYEGEDEVSYIYRVCAMKEQIGTWQQVADILNASLDKNYGESKYRKDYAQFVKVSQVVEEKVVEDDEYLQQLKEERIALEMEKVKLRDERTDLQKSIREAARRESFIDLIERVFSENIEPFEYSPRCVKATTQEMVVCVSDLHTGIEIQNAWNTFNTEILRKRLYRYLDEIIEVQAEQRCNTCHVVLGGDLISGIIHANLRLQNNEDVIRQLKIVITYIGEFINELQLHFNKVYVHSVNGNHSRISPEKEQQLKGENLDSMVPFCMSLMFKLNPKVIIDEEMIDESIGSFKTEGGKLFYFVHGDKDKMSTVATKLTMITGVKPDGIIMGHMHHNALETQHDVKIIMCGCMSGSDSYCVDKRISGSAEQLFFITTAEKTIKALYEAKLQ